MPPVIALAVLGAYLLVCAESYLATHAAGVFRVSFLGVGPTELRIILAAGAVFAVRKPWIVPAGLGPVLLFDVGGVVALVCLAATFVTCAVRQTHALYRAEPLPVAQKVGKAV